MITGPMKINRKLDWTHAAIRMFGNSTLEAQAKVVASQNKLLHAMADT
jgi:hypothetical protein